VVYIRFSDRANAIALLSFAAEIGDFFEKSPRDIGESERVERFRRAGAEGTEAKLMLFVKK